MSNKRNKVIQEVIRKAIEDGIVVDGKEVLSFSVDGDGTINAYSMPSREQSNDASPTHPRVWDYTIRPLKNYTWVGCVKPFKGNGWKKHLYDASGARYIGDKK